jgi:hypothetical protein
LELRDFIVTPIFIILVYVVAYFVRPMLTNDVTRKYYFPGLTVKIIGALAIGFIYQFYYKGGDTFAYHTHGSRPIWEMIMETPITGFEALFRNGTLNGEFFAMSDNVWFWRDTSSFFIVRIATLFDLFTFSTYSATAILFAVFGFIGSWMLYLTFYRIQPDAHLSLAICCLFIPSVIFWGSGILKDTVTLSLVGIATYECNRLFIQKRFSILHLIILIVSLYFVYEVRKFLLQAFLPAALLWIFFSNLNTLRSTIAKATLLPAILVAIILVSYWSIKKVGEGDRRYALEKLSQTSRTTAYDIRYWTGREAGSGYSLGELDGSFASMLLLAPAAINVSLFRPYLWEVNNVLMLFSSLEALVMLIITGTLIARRPVSFFRSFSDPSVLFCFAFSITFAFAAGVSTYNFGSLARYKIQMLPYYLIGLVLVENYIRRNRQPPVDPTIT